jgi:hypothetical protein
VVGIETRENRFVEAFSEKPRGFAPAASCTSEAIEEIGHRVNVWP